jgi:hypothetical protein
MRHECYFLRMTTSALIIACFVAANVQAQSEDVLELRRENLRLEATVEELTLQLAEALEERNNLREALSEAMRSQSSGKKVVSGCDILEIKERVAYSSAPMDTVLARWLRSENNAKKCTRIQLMELRDTYNLQSWTDSSEIINFELGQR